MITVGDAGTKQQDNVFEDGHVNDGYLSSHFVKGVKLVGEISQEISERIASHVRTCEECRKKVDLFREYLSYMPWKSKED